MRPPIDAIRSTAQSTIRVNGVDLVADLSGALWWPGRRTLCAGLNRSVGYAFRPDPGGAGAWTRRRPWRL